MEDERCTVTSIKWNLTSHLHRATTAWTEYNYATGWTTEEFGFKSHKG
jgi:hypothetical protein